MTATGTTTLFKAPTQVTLDVHICDQRRSYRVTFATERQAIEFVERKSQPTDAHPYGNQAFFEVDECPLVPWFLALDAVLNPECEHGLAASLCSGPNHYGEPGDVGFD
jgi:hypothetical protein